MTGVPDKDSDGFLPRLVAAQKPLTWALAKRGVGPERAEELAQEASLRALRARARYCSDRDMLPWLLLIAWRVELDERRRQRSAFGVPARGGDRDEELLVAGPSGPSGEERSPPAAAAMLKEATERVGRAVNELSEMRRQVVSLFYRDGLGIQQIAARLSVADGTVKSHLHRAREEIAARLARRDEE